MLKKKGAEHVYERVQKGYVTHLRASLYSPGGKLVMVHQPKHVRKLHGSFRSLSSEVLPMIQRPLGGSLLAVLQQGVHRMGGSPGLAVKVRLGCYSGRLRGLGPASIGATPPVADLTSQPQSFSTPQPVTYGASHFTQLSSFLLPQPIQYPTPSLRLPKRFYHHHQHPWWRLQNPCFSYLQGP